MKKHTTVFAVLLILAVLLAGFEAPALLGKMIEKKNTTEVRVTEADAISFSASKGDSIDLIRMLNGKVDNLTEIEVDSGYVYTKEQAWQYARDILLKYHTELGFDDPAELNEQYALNLDDIDAVGHFYLYTEADDRHNALIWTVTIVNEDTGNCSTVTFDDASGAVLAIDFAMPEKVLESIDTTEKYELYYITEACLNKYAELAKLSLQPDFRFDLLNISVNKNEWYLYGFTFTLGSDSGQSEEVTGYWIIRDEVLSLVIAPGDYPIEVSDEWETNTQETDGEMELQENFEKAIQSSQ